MTSPTKAKQQIKTIIRDFDKKLTNNMIRLCSYMYMIIGNQEELVNLNKARLQELSTVSYVVVANMQNQKWTSLRHRKLDLNTHIILQNGLYHQYILTKNPASQIIIQLT